MSPQIANLLEFSAFWIFVKIVRRKILQASFVLVLGHVRGPDVVPAVVPGVPVHVRLLPVEAGGNVGELRQTVVGLRVSPEYIKSKK